MDQPGAPRVSRSGQLSIHATAPVPGTARAHQPRQCPDRGRYRPCCPACARGGLFPALDADLTLTVRSAHATMPGLRVPAGRRRGRRALRWTGTSAAGSLRDDPGLRTAHRRCHRRSGWCPCARAANHGPATAASGAGDALRTGHQVTGTMTAIFHWLRKPADQLIPLTPRRPLGARSGGHCRHGPPSTTAPASDHEPQLWILTEGGSCANLCAGAFPLPAGHGHAASRGWRRGRP
jgi:hypothetical protein